MRKESGIGSLSCIAVFFLRLLSNARVEDVEELKEMVNLLAAMLMNPQNRGEMEAKVTQIRALIKSRKSLFTELSKAGYVAES